MGTYEPTTKERKCVFCEIVAGNIPAGTIWEDEDFLAFLSIDPNTEGYSCVIPKAHVGSDVLKMPDETLKKFIVAAKETAQVLEAYFTDVGRVGVIMEGTGIDHAHIKLSPMHGTEHMRYGEWKQYPSGQTHWFDVYEGWISSAGGPNVDHATLATLAQKIREGKHSQDCGPLGD